MTKKDGKFTGEFEIVGNAAVTDEDRRLLALVTEEALSQGGAGSGNFGHAGRPGERGGSAPGEGGGGSDEKSDSGQTTEWAENAKIQNIKNINLKNIKKERLASIKRAADDILVANGVEIDSVSWFPDEMENNPNGCPTGRCGTTRQQDGTITKIEIEFSKAFTNDPESLIKPMNVTWENQRQTHIALAQLSGNTGLEEAMTKCVRWDSYSDAEDPVYANAVHEDLHAVSNHHPEMIEKFVDGLNKRDITISDTYAVSQYAVRDKDPYELFSETGACIAAGCSIPDNIKEAFFESGVKIGKNKKGGEK
jgi:hypothetical protein